MCSFLIFRCKNLDFKILNQKIFFLCFRKKKGINFKKIKNPSSNNRLFYRSFNARKK
jgi:hypothetical protein